jgi:N-acylneuraminate cytidylyltransferase
MKIKALLPMKGHSERVPNKNLRDFHGRPLYHAVMQSLVDSKYIDAVVINTDSDKIKQDALEAFREKLVIHDRPEGIQGDFIPMNDIIGYDLDHLEGEHFLQTHSTNPLLLSKTIDDAIEDYFKALSEGFDSLFSVTRLQTRLYDGEGAPINHNPNELIRTQDLPSVYEENSCFYIFSRSSFNSAAGRRIGLKPKMYVMDKLEAIDIDEEHDFILAETLYKLRERL